MTIDKAREKYGSIFGYHLNVEYVFLDIGLDVENEHHHYAVCPDRGPNSNGNYDVYLVVTTSTSRGGYALKTAELIGLEWNERSEVVFYEKKRKDDE